MTRGAPQRRPDTARRRPTEAVRATTPAASRNQARFAWQRDSARPSWPPMAGSSGRFDPADPLPGEDPERLDAVAPGDLLPLVPGPGRIADRYFKGPDTPA